MQCAQELKPCPPRRPRRRSGVPSAAALILGVWALGASSCSPRSGARSCGSGSGCGAGPRIVGRADPRAAPRAGRGGRARRRRPPLLLVAGAGAGGARHSPARDLRAAAGPRRPHRRAAGGDARPRARPPGAARSVLARAPAGDRLRSSSSSRSTGWPAAACGRSRRC